VQKRNTWLNLVLSMAMVAGASVGTAVAQKQGVTPPPDKVAIGEDEAKQLVLLMDTDKNGKVSKKEFMAFMEAEFKRLDKDKNGELDVNELKQSQFRPSAPAPVGK
jgi:hypothetical protein